MTSGRINQVTIVVRSQTAGPKPCWIQRIQSSVRYTFF